MARPRKPKPQDPQVLDPFGKYLRDARPAAIEPVEFLEARRKAYVVELEEVADAALRSGDWDLRRRTLVDLTRMTSLAKYRLDITASNLGLVKGPDLTGLTDEEIERLKIASAEDLESIVEKLKGEETDGGA